MKRLFLQLLAGSMLMACGNSQQPPPAPSQQTAAPAPAPIERLTITKDSVVSITTLADANQSYSIYYPAKAAKPENCAILVCFDPHGDGRLPIDKYRKWANKFGVAIAGSNASRNGLSAADGQQIAGNMIADISSRLGFDKKNITLCGFSGGAKVAINALDGNPDISNLIYAGAVTQLSNSRPINILGFAGNQDMNYTDLLQFAASVPGSTLIEFNGKHEWPDVQTFENAFYWLLLEGYSQHTLAADSNIINDYINYSKEQILLAQKNGDLLKAHQYADNAYGLLHSINPQGVSFSSYCQQIAISISAMPAYKKAVDQKDQTLQKEAGEKQVIQQAFQNQGPDWWAKVINGYKASTSPSDKRLLGFISLACFSYSNQMLQQHNLDGAERILAIYEMCDPGNTDQLYFHAILYAQKNNNAMALKYLQKAVSNGFNDINKMDAEQAFIQLRNDPSYSQIVASLKKVSR